VTDCEGGRKLSLADLVLSVLPWPFHKSLPAVYCGKNSKATFWDLVLFSLPRPFYRDLPRNDADDDDENEREANPRRKPDEAG